MRPQLGPACFLNILVIMETMRFWNNQRPGTGGMMGVRLSPNIDSALPQEGAAPSPTNYGQQSLNRPGRSCVHHWPRVPSERGLHQKIWAWGPAGKAWADNRRIRRLPNSLV